MRDRHLARAVAAAFAFLAVAACDLSALGSPPDVTPATATGATQQPAAPASPPAAGTAAEHRIGVRAVGGRGEFYDRQTGQTFVVRGANYVFVPSNGDRYALTLLREGIYDPAQTRADFARLASYGYNTARVFLDHCGSGAGCIGDADGEGLNPAYLDNVADMMAAAREAGIVILFTSNDLPDQGGYAEEANSQSGSTFAGYRNSYYLTPGAVSATRRYWRDILTGLTARGAAFDAVLGWELLNEQWMFTDQPPLSLTSGTVETTTGTYDMSDPAQKPRMVSEGLIYYISEMKAEILAHDPTALVTMGFFAPEIAAPGWYVETASLLAGADLDFFDFHAYPGGASLAAHAEHFGMQGYDQKPIVMGEYGAFRHLYGDVQSGARALTGWVAESCALGFDGWLYWTSYPANADAGDRTWGMTDEDDFLLELLAPANQPDPCAPVAVPTANLAFEKPVSVSNALPSESPEFAVDENEGSQWGAGAHPPQWIEVDLQGAYRVTEIRLLVAQYPDGDSVHRIAVRAPGASGLTTVHEFSGPTRDGDWLTFTPQTPLENVGAIQVYTVSSPSWVAWKEIQIFGEVMP